MRPTNEPDAHVQYFEDLLRQMEIESYSKILSVFRAKGNLTEDRRKLLKQISSFLNIPGERHRAEARKVSTNSTLCAIAEKLTGNDGTLDWFEEGKRNVPIPERYPVNTIFTPLADYVAGIASLGSSYLEKTNKAFVTLSSIPATSNLEEVDKNIEETISGIVKTGNLRDASVQTMRRKARVLKSGCTYCKRRKEIKKKKLAVMCAKNTEDEKKDLCEKEPTLVTESPQLIEKEEQAIISLPSGKQIVIENTVNEEDEEQINSLSATIIAQEVEIETEPEFKSIIEDVAKSAEASSSHGSGNDPLHFYDHDTMDSVFQYLTSRTPRILSSGQLKRSKSSPMQRELSSSGKEALSDRKKRKPAAERELEDSIWSGTWAARSQCNFITKCGQRKNLTDQKSKTNISHGDDIILQSDIESELGYTKKKPDSSCSDVHTLEGYSVREMNARSNIYKKEYRTHFRSSHRKMAKSQSGQDDQSIEEYGGHHPETISKGTSQTIKLQKSQSIAKSTSEESINPHRESHIYIIPEKEDKNSYTSSRSDSNIAMALSSHVSNWKQSYKTNLLQSGRIASYSQDISGSMIEDGLCPEPVELLHSPHTYSKKPLKRISSVNGKLKKTYAGNLKSLSGAEFTNYSGGGEPSKTKQDTSFTNIHNFIYFDMSSSQTDLISSHSNPTSVHSLKMSSNQNTTYHLPFSEEGGLLKKSSHCENDQEINANKIYNGEKKTNLPVESKQEIDSSVHKVLEVETTRTTSENKCISDIQENKVLLNEDIISKSDGAEELAIPIVNGHEDFIVVSGEGEGEILTTDLGHLVIPVTSEDGTLAEVSADGELEFDPNDGRFDSHFHERSGQLQSKNDNKSALFLNGPETEVME